MNKSVIKKIVLLLAIAGIFALFFALNLDRYFSLYYIKESRASFQALYSEYPVLIIAGYMLIYILSTSLSLPGATVLTLAGGALFGLITGVIVVSFASTIGATLACFVSRYLLRDWIQRKFGDKLEIVNKGVEKEGAFYLFTLRLLPAFPFVVINLVMGLTRMRLFTFYWVSQIGMLAGTIVYVNAGNEIAEIDSLSGILSPTLIASFILLGIFPILTKKIIDFYKSRHKIKI